ncbi:hypothetical protein PHMEG_000394 [Phytophthora megakarya]|uniref:DDE Tnp4 domain-containing protein n=1 Tax=Phytophthora megakarya TaxID=4795 RepID=A0A225X5Q7_9STRA|nr:hypothetical protein PHMEG_000394 [Phytophthora megakarya]
MTVVSLMEVGNIVTRERTKATGVKAMCSVLYKLAVPMRWVDLSESFGHSPSGLSNIFLHTTLHLNGDLLDSKLEEFSEAMFAAGAPYTKIWCFIDGTVRRVCRPQPQKVCGKRKYLTQQSVYNGHKRKHSLKFQSLMTPDGMISHLFGPFPGRNHDIKYNSRCDERFKDYRIFRDCAYGRDDVMLSPFGKAVGNMTAVQLQISSSMRKLRVSVEWVLNYWKTLDVKSNLRTGTQPVGKMYHVGVLMNNCITCLRGGNTASDYFKVKFPNIREYLHST